MSSSGADDAAPVAWNAGDIDLRHLRIIVALCEHGNLPAAARSLKLTTATAAARLRSAERALGPMFLAGDSVLHPTSRGVVAVRRARAVLESMEALERRLSRADRQPRGIRVATVTLPFELILPMLREELPGIGWTVRAVPSPAAGMASVADADADLFSGMLRIDDRPGIPRRRGLAVREMLHEPAWVRLPAGHRLASREAVVLGDLAEEVWAVLPDPELEAGLVGAARRAGFEPDIRYRPTDPMIRKNLARSGEAISLNSPLTGQGPGTVLRPVIGGPVYAWVLVHRSGAEVGSLVAAVADVVRRGYRLAATAPGVPEAVRDAGPALV